jgi:hypothetical protein
MAGVSPASPQGLRDNARIKPNDDLLPTLSDLAGARDVGLKPQDTGPGPVAVLTRCQGPAGRFRVLILTSRPEATAR